MYQNFGQQVGDYAKKINVAALPRGQYYLIGNEKWSVGFQKILSEDLLAVGATGK